MMTVILTSSAFFQAVLRPLSTAGTVFRLDHVGAIRLVVPDSVRDEIWKAVDKTSDLSGEIMDELLNKLFDSTCALNTAEVFRAARRVHEDEAELCARFFHVRADYIVTVDPLQAKRLREADLPVVTPKQLLEVLDKDWRQPNT